MPWKETTAMEQKIEFITEWRSGQFAITELCRAFGISRTTAYKYINRFQEKGIEGLYGNRQINPIWSKCPRNDHV
ncbi:MAG: helix-turn-helix domain-containing protein, partial [Desulfobulbaceae bacterium]|nr:helix-turn-helix domain-containing protein [Desulfobulbaceae bacterium]